MKPSCESSKAELLWNISNMKWKQKPEHGFFFRCRNDLKLLKCLFFSQICRSFNLFMKSSVSIILYIYILKPSNSSLQACLYKFLLSLQIVHLFCSLTGIN